MGNNCILPKLFESRMYENYFYKFAMSPTPSKLKE